MRDAGIVYPEVIVNTIILPFKLTDVNSFIPSCHNITQKN